MKTFRLTAALTAALIVSAGVWRVAAQSAAKPGASQDKPANAAPVSVTPPPDYLIGPADLLFVGLWRDKDLSGDVVVRPDGKISLPLVNEIQAAGLTTEQLRATLTTAYTKFNEDPTVFVTVRQINSRNVFITGQVVKPGMYPLNGPMTVIQLIAAAGGLNDYADKGNIVVVRGGDKRPDGVPWSFKINYNDLISRKNLQQNIELKPGDTVIVG